MKFDFRASKFSEVSLDVLLLSYMISIFRNLFLTILDPPLNHAQLCIYYGLLTTAIKAS